jgi:excisionase family DNA binding protein
VTDRTRRPDVPPDAPVPGPPGSGEPDPGAAGGKLAYSVTEAASLTGLSRDLLYDQMRRGNLGYIKIGRRRLITRQHLQRFLGIVPGPGTLWPCPRPGRITQLPVGRVRRDRGHRPLRTAAPSARR